MDNQRVRVGNTSGGLMAFAVLLALVGLSLLGGGIYLIGLGGSWYYALIGASWLVAAVSLWRREMLGVWVCLASLGFTLVWALAEVGLNFWALEVRLVAPIFLAGLALVLVPATHAAKGRPTHATPYVFGGVALLLCFCGFIVAMFFPHGVVLQAQAPTKGIARPATVAMAGEWHSYGRTGEATRYAPFDQINVTNVGRLRQVWAARSGDIAVGEEGKEDQNTPLYVDGILYHCSPTNRVTAMDGASGKILWQFDPQSAFAFWKRCRALGYHHAQTQTPAAAQPAAASHQGQGSDGPCAARLFVATNDARLIALDAKTGQICPAFGQQGTVDLKVGMGEVPPGFYVPTTGPIVAGTRILIGGWVADNYSVGEPSGVVRAFDVLTGELAWAWDLGNPGHSGAPASGATYTRGTPNVWAPMAFDLELGMAYLPLGNATPDYYGGQRRAFDDEYNASVVALDLATGKEKWHYRTVRHDIWDYDLPAQPTLVSFPDGKGGSTPALIQTTKRGQFFVLDRRTGKPLIQIADKPAPHGDGTATGEVYSPTQPYAVGMASIGTEPLTEARMWGMTPIDQLACRILFRQHAYAGEFTPQSTRPTLTYPGNNGGPNWGGISVDEERNILVVADMRMPVSAQLIPRKDLPSQEDYKPDPHGAVSPQFGLPFGQKVVNFFSPLGVPCLEPPIGTLSAIDLGSRQLRWQRPAGTMKDVTVAGIQPRLAMYVGMPALGGAVTTRGGLSFYSATQDYYLRALSTETGEELWKARLPSGSQATPMTYIDKHTGRQFVVVTAGGARYNPNDRGDWIIAFALP
ncbi:MAG: membrane-bound PQQ-dependent dehydrogenase, glucose/quinate/shikimate family [Proteobacteria bacterium]|nr:membrane-bound PQQ-dependent dehydrogenase, glucose/quinate/shikimate family [Pseudomonadota bacterium]